MTLARLLFTTSAAFCALALLGCSKGGGAEGRDEPVGSARFSVQSVPADVQCIAVTAEGTRTRTESFDVTPNQSAQFVMASLPSGSVTFTGQAYSVRCNKVKDSTLPTWISDPVTADVAPGGVTPVTLVMRPVGSADIGVDFQDGGRDSGTGGRDGGTGGAGGTAGTGGTSGTGGTGATGGTAGTGGSGATGGTGGLPSGVWDSTNWDNATWQ